MTPNTMTNIERNVMRRVRIIRMLRPFVSNGALASLALVAALWGIGREVWVARVFENMPQAGDALAALRFFLAAFVSTDVLVQALALVVLGSLVFLAHETARLISRALVSLQTAA